MEASQLGPVSDDLTRRDARQEDLDDCPSQADDDHRRDLADRYAARHGIAGPAGHGENQQDIGLTGAPCWLADNLHQLFFLVFHGFSLPAFFGSSGLHRFRVWNHADP